MIKYYYDIEQGTPAWHAARCGILTASVVSQLVTAKTLKVANNDTVRTMAYEYAAQRETDHTEDGFQNYHMMRGHMEEGLAREAYATSYYEVRECGFITNDDFGFTLGYSPDGIVGDDGLIEIKSRMAKHQVKTILFGEVPPEYMLQIQTALLVTGRSWLDFISYSNGMPLFVKRVEPYADMIELIKSAAHAFELRIEEIRAKYRDSSKGLIPTERVDLNFGDDFMN